jgi:WD40 repeat protein
LSFRRYRLVLISLFSFFRYDGTNLNLVATASSDATVKVWDTGNGQLQASFSGGGSQPMLGVDISGGIICGCGADKTCRVWRYDTKRMVRRQDLSLFSIAIALLTFRFCTADSSTSWTLSKDHLREALSW